MNTLEYTKKERKDKKEDTLKKSAVIFICILAVAAFANADIYVKTKMHQDAFSMMGQNQPAEDSISEQWIGKDQVAMIQEKTGFTVDSLHLTFFGLCPDCQ